MSFWIESPDVQVRLSLPRWNTRSLYSAPHRNSDIGRIGFLRLDASYSYFAEVHPENIDQLKLSFTVSAHEMQVNVQSDQLLHLDTGCNLQTIRLDNSPLHDSPKQLFWVLYTLLYPL